MSSFSPAFSIFIFCWLLRPAIGKSYLLPFSFFSIPEFLGCTIYFLWLCKLPVLPCPVMIAVKRSCLWAKNSKDFLYNFSLLCAVHSSITFFITLIHEFKILQFSQKVNSFSMHSFCDTNMHQFLHQITFVQRL